MSNKNKRSPDEKLIECLDTTATTLHKIAMTVEDFYEDTQAELFGTINELVANLNELNQTKDLTSLSFPAEALRVLDDDIKNNPEILSESLTSRTKQLNEKVKFKQEALLLLKSEITRDWSIKQDHN